MKRSTSRWHSVRLVAVALIFAFVAGCGADNGNQADSKENKPESKEPSKTKDSKPPEKSDEGKDDAKAEAMAALAKKLDGYWAPNMEEMVRMATEKLAQAGNTNPDHIKRVKELTEKAAGVLLMEIRNGTATKYQAGRKSEDQFTVVSADEAEETLALQFGGGKGSKTGQAVIKGESLTFTRGVGKTAKPMILQRINESEFLDRKETLDKLKGNGFTGFPSG